MRENNSLRKILTNEGLTQAEVARAAGISHGTISKVYHQKRRPSIVTIMRIVNAVNRLAYEHYKVEEVFPEEEGLK